MNLDTHFFQGLYRLSRRRFQPIRNSHDRKQFRFPTIINDTLAILFPPDDFPPSLGRNHRLEGFQKAFASYPIRHAMYLHLDTTPRYALETISVDLRSLRSFQP